MDFYNRQPGKETRPSEAEQVVEPGVSNGSLSPDRNWYWDGAAWRSTMSPDGRWRWSGAVWEATGVDPAQTTAPSLRDLLDPGATNLGLNRRQVVAFLHELTGLPREGWALVGDPATTTRIREISADAMAVENHMKSSRGRRHSEEWLRRQEASASQLIANWRSAGNAERFRAAISGDGVRPPLAALLEVLPVLERIGADDRIALLLTIATLALVTRVEVTEAEFQYLYAPAAAAIPPERLGPETGILPVALPPPTRADKGPFGPNHRLVDKFLRHVSALPEDVWNKDVHPDAVQFMSIGESARESDPSIRDPEQLIQKMEPELRDSARVASAATELVMATMISSNEITAGALGRARPNPALGVPPVVENMLQLQANRHFALSQLVETIGKNRGHQDGVTAARAAAVTLPGLNLQRGILAADAAAALAVQDALATRTLSVIYRPFAEAITLQSLMAELP